MSLTHERRSARYFCRDSGNIAQQYSYIIRKGKTEKKDEEKKNENFEPAAGDGCQLYDGVWQRGLRVGSGL